MRFVNSALLLLMLSGSVTAQTTSALHLSDYVGTYADAPGHTLEIVDATVFSPSWMTPSTGCAPREWISSPLSPAKQSRSSATQRAR
jgi:hypothetical protein